MCYRDMTFCTNEKCAKFGYGIGKCGRSLTPTVQKAADDWWGKGEGEAPIAISDFRNTCYVVKP